MSNLPKLNSVIQCAKCLLTHTLPQCLASYTYMPAINGDSKPSDIAFRERNNIPLTECMQRRCSRCGYPWIEDCSDDGSPSATSSRTRHFDYATEPDKTVLAIIDTSKVAEGKQYVRIPDEETSKEILESVREQQEERINREPGFEKYSKDYVTSTKVNPNLIRELTAFKNLVVKSYMAIDYCYKAKFFETENCYIAKCLEYQSVREYGDTQQQAIERLRETIAAMLANLVESGMPIKDPASDLEREKFLLED